MTIIATVLPDVDTPAPALIRNDGFFPDIDPVMFREQHRIRDAVTPARAREALIAGILTVGRDLAAWAAGHRAAGITHLPEPILLDQFAGVPTGTALWAGLIDDAAGGIEIVTR